MASIYDLKIFRLNRIRYEELWNDAISWIKQTYNATSEQFTMASPFAQILSVVLHLGRMILYYIEDSITGLNIKSAYRPDQIRGLARLSGHNAGRAISARGAIKLIYKDTGNMDLNNNVMFIPNKIKILSAYTGMTYTVLFGADSAQITLVAGNYINATIIQGTIKYQSATASGGEFQSYNFTERNYADIDEYFINVYVNGELWDKVESLQDLGFRQKGCIVKTGMTGGIDIIFGNGLMGEMPEESSTIYVEYVVTDGLGGNLPKEYANNDEAFQIQGVGYLKDGTEISLNENFKIQSDTDVIFGLPAEDVQLTQLIAPHASRSFVLANEINYKYFFKRMNMFSTIEVIKGFSQRDINYMAQLNYDVYNTTYRTTFNEWQEAVTVYGEKSNEAKQLYDQLQDALSKRNFAQQQIEDTHLADNTVYILLIPDISKRIPSAANYFTCDESVFTLTTEEQANLINLIDNSGQRIITVENKIIQPKMPRFAINTQVKIWDGYNLKSIYASCLQALSNYLISYNRKDIIPISDIVALFESVEGIDSVKVWFDADVENEKIYAKQNFYGIDEYGDIVLSRQYQNMNGNTRDVNDILPLIRGGFTSPEGTVYSDQQSYDSLSAFNMTLIGYTRNTKLNLQNYRSL